MLLSDSSTMWLDRLSMCLKKCYVNKITIVFSVNTVSLTTKINLKIV